MPAQKTNKSLETEMPRQVEFKSKIRNADDILITTLEFRLPSLLSLF